MFLTICLLFQVLLFCISLAGPSRPHQSEQNGVLAFFRSPTFFCFSVAVVFVLGRWPWLNFNRELNPDESVWLANALRYLQDIVPWRSTDSGTSGPLTPWLLASLAQMGFSLGYVTAHFVATTLQLISLLCVYGAIRNICNDISARLATMPFALLLSLTGEPNFLHLSSENLPNFLIALGCFLATRSLKKWKFHKTAFWESFTVGILLGSVNFSKLQAVPIAWFLGILFVFWISNLPLNRKQRILELVYFTAGFCCVPIIILGIVISNGAWNDMWRLYIYSNLQYGNKAAAGSSYMGRIVGLIGSSEVFSNLSRSLAGLGAIVFVSRGLLNSKSLKRGEQTMLTVSIVFLLVALFCVAKPGHHFLHYLLLLVSPLMILTGILLWLILTAKETKLWHFLAMGILSFAPISAISQQVMTHGASMVSAEPVKPETRAVAQIFKATDFCAIWGWRPDIYVNGCPNPAVRDMVTVGPFFSVDARNACRDRFLDDLKRNKPRIFIDAICFSGSLEQGWYTTGPALIAKLEGYEPFRELDDYVSGHYILNTEVPCNQDHRFGVIRIYERKAGLN